MSFWLHFFEFLKVDSVLFVTSHCVRVMKLLVLIVKSCFVFRCYLLSRNFRREVIEIKLIIPKYCVKELKVIEIKLIIPKYCVKELT